MTNTRGGRVASARPVATGSAAKITRIFMQEGWKYRFGHHVADTVAVKANAGPVSLAYSTIWVLMESEDGLDTGLKAQGYVLPCVTRAEGDVQLDA
jgi:hypothetical protein